MKNRPIKFRAWSLEYKQWMNHCSVIDSEGNILVLYYEQKEDGISPIVFDYPLDRVIIQQFTGLTDSTGKEIYEGDILEELIRNESATQLGVCKQILGGWRIFSLPDSKNCWHGWKQKVVGNIFETPELLV